MKKYLYLLVIVFTALYISACEDAAGPADTETGSIYIQSSPAGAQIWVDGSNKNRVTPDSVVSLAVGNHEVTLKLNGYRDTSFTVNVLLNRQSSRSVTLSQDLENVMYTDTLWETAGTTAAQPSGLDLSAGIAVPISNNNNYDIYYTSNGFVIRSSESRVAAFYLSGFENINDDIDSPEGRAAGTAGWTNSVPDRTPYYFFIFDADGHYSKMKVTKSGGGTPGEDAWVIVQWYYNTREGDRNF